MFLGLAVVVVVVAVVAVVVVAVGTSVVVVFGASVVDQVVYQQGHITQGTASCNELAGKANSQSSKTTLRNKIIWKKK